MTPFQGLLSSSKGACKFKRSLYGLKQMSKVWYENFCFTLFGFSFTQSQYDFSLCIHNMIEGIVNFDNMHYFIDLKILLRLGNLPISTQV